MIVFDRSLVQKRHRKAAPFFWKHDYLYRHSEEGLIQRLSFVKRCFDKILILGRCTQTLTEALQALAQPPSLLLYSDCIGSRGGGYKPFYVAADEEALPFREQSFDLVLMPSGLHAVNDVPGTLHQIQSILKPDGLFLASFFGGETLVELRQILFAIETETRGGVSPRISPFIELATAAALLGRAGFSLPVADRNVLKASFRDMYQLMFDLKGMGESNALVLREKTLTPRSLFKEAAKRYSQMFGAANGKILATFEIFYLTGWGPHPNQPKALKPGSAQQNLADILKS